MSVDCSAPHDSHNSTKKTNKHEVELEQMKEFKVNVIETHGKCRTEGWNNVNQNQNQ